jgi:RNA polymerase sigma-70 factor, ECF subfamily
VTSAARAGPRDRHDDIVVRRGDDDGRLRAFFDRAIAEVYPYVARRCGYDRTLAEDLVQETLVTAVTALGRDVDHLSIGWMIAVARSRLIDHYRAEARRERPLRLVVDRQAPPDAEVVGRDVTGRMLAILPAQQRLCVVLHHLDGLPISEVAVATGLSVRAVESSLARARRALRVAVERDEGD